MLPSAGTNPLETAAQLRGRLVQLRNIASSSTDPDRYAAAYVEWVHIAERFLREKFTEVPLERLHTERFSHINSRTSVRPWDQLREEIEVQFRWLERTADELERMAGLFEDPEARIAVPDTHILLHYKPLSEIAWEDIVDHEPIRLVIPRRVVDELDEKKFARRGELADRARSVIRQLSRYLASPGELRDGLYIALVGKLDLDPLAYRHPRPPADVEILDACEALGAYNGLRGGATLVSGDLGMRMRAADRGVSVAEIPDDFLLQV